MCYLNSSKHKQKQTDLSTSAAEFIKRCSHHGKEQMEGAASVGLYESYITCQVYQKIKEPEIFQEMERDGHFQTFGKVIHGIH